MCVCVCHTHTGAGISSREQAETAGCRGFRKAAAGLTRCSSTAVRRATLSWAGKWLIWLARRLTACRRAGAHASLAGRQTGGHMCLAGRQTGGHMCLAGRRDKGLHVPCRQAEEQASSASACTTSVHVHCLACQDRPYTQPVFSLSCSAILSDKRTSQNQSSATAGLGPGPHHQALQVVPGLDGPQVVERQVQQGELRALGWGLGPDSAQQVLIPTALIGRRQRVHCWDSTQ